MDTRLIAFYLPQFYPTKENDEWWAKGFTEWTNVGNAKPLFKGHYQPKVPADLGYYDLRIPEFREQQAELAREAGIEGFCYWHYWFEGRRLLDRVFSEVVESGNPDFPFCLCWANHSWYQKTWDPNKPDKLLIEQTYGGVEDYIAHFKEMLPAFKDKRYILIDGRLAFGIYKPLLIPEFKEFKSIWNKLAKENGLPEFYFFGFTFKYEEVADILNVGYDTAVYDGVQYINGHLSKFKHFCSGLRKKIFHKPRVVDYKAYTKHMLEFTNKDETFIPCVNPNFDHSPRSAERGTIMVDSTPENWGKLLSQTIHICKERKTNKDVVFVKAWNEWGEGNYMEPDLKYGKGYIEETRKALENS